MIKYYCDRCGKLMLTKEYHSAFAVSNPFCYNDPYMEDDEVDTEKPIYLYLCESCKEKYKNFMKNKEANNNE